MMIIRTTWLVGLLLCCASCASLVNKSNTKFQVVTNGPAMIVVDQDTLLTQKNKVWVFTERSPLPLNLQILNDSITKSISLPAKRSLAYWGNAYPLFWPGLFTESDKALSYTYKGPIYVDVQDTIPQFFRHSPFDKTGTWQVHLSLPYLNSFYLQPEMETTKVNTGFWGLSLGLDYYYRNRRSIHLSASGATSFFFPIPAAVDISGEWQVAGTWYVAAAHQQEWKRLRVGYGLSFARSTWAWKYANAFDPPPPTRPEALRRHHSMGLLLSSHVRTGKRFHIGLLYRPTFLRFDSAEKALAYEHLLSLDLAWKFRLN